MKTTIIPHLAALSSVILSTTAYSRSISYWSDITGQNRSNNDWVIANGNCNLAYQQASQLEAINVAQIQQQNQNCDGKVVCGLAALSSVAGAFAPAAAGNKAYQACMQASGWNQYQAPQSGYGEIKFLDGTAYAGEFLGGQYSGRGNLTLANGVQYQGEFKSSNFEGRGILFKPNLFRYDGMWLKGKKDGFGSESYINGSKYEGIFKQNLYDGEGIFTFANGVRYSGNWLKGKQDGQGSRVFANGARYDGQFRLGKYEGRGVFVDSDGAKYDGYWRAGLRFGRGIQTFSNGDRYDGSWVAGYRFGRGVALFADGSKYSGLFDDSPDRKRFGFLAKKILGSLEVVKITEAGVAAANGLRIGDLIVNLNGAPTASMSASDMYKIFNENKKLSAVLKDGRNISLSIN